MRSVLAWLGKPWGIIPCCGGLVFLLVLGLRLRGGLESLELAAFDRMIRIAARDYRETRITSIEVSEQDIQALGWPLSDATLARALKTVLKQKPRAVGLDIYRDLPVPPGSDELARVLGDNPNLVAVMTLGERGVAPPAPLKGTDQAAFGDIVVDAEGTVRRGLLFADDGRNVYTSFALRLASLYLAPEGIGLEPDPADPLLMRLGQTTIPALDADEGGYRRADAAGYQFLLDFQQGGAPFATYPFSALLKGEVPAAALAGKIVLIGVNSDSVKDHFYTPLGAAGHQLSGTVLHGYIAGQLLRFAFGKAAPIRAPSEKYKVALLLAASLAGSAVGFRTRSARAFSVALAAGLLVIGGGAAVLFMQRWWIPLVPSALAFSLAATGTTAYVTGLEKRERAALMSLFSRYVAKEIAEMIWRARDQFLDNGRPRAQSMTATVFFSDLRGFTTLAEKMPPAELIDWLNTYMEAMAGLIMRHGGVVDDYAGDGIKANFGVPFPRRGEEEIAADAANAVACALAMEKEMHRLNGEWEERGLPEMGIRVGIYTGPVVAGLLGSSSRLKYTTVGDAVNTASRLESYDKEVGREALCRVLIGDSTLKYLKGRYQSERIGEVALKGKEERITVHCITGETND